MLRESRQGSWTNRWTFVAAATGAAIGLGNIWKFSYLAGANGGAAFIVIYLACVLLVALPVLIAEVLLGVRGRANPVAAMEIAAIEAGASRRWRWLGALAMLAALMVLSYYSVIAGWVLAYVETMWQSGFVGGSVQVVGEYFNDFLSDPAELLFWHSCFMAMVALLVALGVPQVLARTVRLMIPLLFIALIILAVYGIKFGDADSALAFMFDVDWRQVDSQVVFVALGHAFFSLSIGFGAMMCFGAYAPQRASLPGLLSLVVLMDTAVSLLAGLAIFPLVFSLNIEPGMGPGLMFIALPYAFGHMVYGEYLGLLFFVAVSVTALTSAVALLEPATAWLVERRSWPRLAAAVTVAFLVWALGLISLLSFNLWSDWQWLQMNPFEWVDFISANILLPLVAWLLAVFVGWRMRPEVLRDELQADSISWQSRLIFSLWLWFLRYIAAPALLLILAVPLYQRWFS